MPIHHGELIRKLQNDPSLKTKTANRNAAIQGEVSNTLRDTMDLFDQVSGHEAANFALWHDLWLQFGTFGTNKNGNRKYATHQWSRGRLLSIDFGLHNIGKEFSYNHPGVVVADYMDMIVVVPMTGDKGQTFAPDTDHAMLRVKSVDPRMIDSNGKQISLQKDSIFQVPHIRCVSKNRIRNDMNISISGTAMMAEIEEKIIDVYAPSILQRYQLQINQLRTDIGTMKQNYEQKIAQLTTQLQEVNEAKLPLAAATEEKDIDK